MNKEVKQKQTSIFLKLPYLLEQCYQVNIILSNAQNLMTRLHENRREIHVTHNLVTRFVLPEQYLKHVYPTCSASASVLNYPKTS